jgi:hypothetical protein
VLFSARFCSKSLKRAILATTTKNFTPDLMLISNSFFKSCKKSSDKVTETKNNVLHNDAKVIFPSLFRAWVTFMPEFYPTSPADLKTRIFLYPYNEHSKQFCKL